MPIAPHREDQIEYPSFVCYDRCGRLLFWATISIIGLLCALSCADPQKSDVKPEIWEYADLDNDAVAPFMGEWKRVTPDIKLAFSHDQIFGENVFVAPQNIRIKPKDFGEIQRLEILYNNATAPVPWITGPLRIGRKDRPGFYEISLTDTSCRLLIVVPGITNRAFLSVRLPPISADIHSKEWEWKFAGLYEQVEAKRK